MITTWGAARAWWEIVACAGSVGTPVDTTLTIPTGEAYCDSGAIEIDSVAAGSGIVEINGAWRLS